MVNEEIIKDCREAINSQLGQLDDIPYDLANTIANIYYKYFLIGEDLIQNPIPKSIIREENILNEMQAFRKEHHNLEFKLKAIPDLLMQLRSIKKDKCPNLYNMWVHVCYDILKYDIKFAMKKTGIRRAIERYFKRSKVNEIPRLINLIQVE
ncbi:hypothetical protein ACFL7D_02015 [candidate division KSB1 bacterium]